MAADSWNNILEGIYTAALDRQQWSQVLLQIGDALSGASTTMSVHSMGGGVAWEQTARLDPDCTAIAETQYTHPGTNPLLCALAQLEVNEPLPLETVVPARQLK